MTVQILPTFKKEVSESVIKVAREILELAEAGEITSLAAVMIGTDGDSHSKISSTLTKRAMIGGVMFLLHDMLHG